MQQQRGGGSGTGGFGFTLSNEMGKVYADVPRGSCVLPQRGGASNPSGSANESLVSYPAGYGYDTRSVNEINNGTAHFLAQLPYGRHMMGGKKSHKSRRQKSQRKSRKSHQKSRKRQNSQRQH
jgi:hypothetical protein